MYVFQYVEEKVNELPFSSLPCYAESLKPVRYKVSNINNVFCFCLVTQGFLQAFKILLAVHQSCL